MATITSNGTGGGDWGTGATWVGGVAPVDDDTVVIASGDTVIFNVDTSGFTAGINGMTITGTLKVSTTTSSYMKMKAATFITGAGTFNIGESGAGAIPFAVKFTLTGGSGWYVTGTSGLTMTVYGAEPTYKTIKLSGAEALGQTELSVNTDVRGDIWAVGDKIRIDNVDKDSQSEERTIAVGGIAETTITITAGLTAAKLSSSLVHLMTRNIAIIGAGAGSQIRNFTDGKLIIGGGQFIGGTTYIIENCTSISISGGTFTGVYGVRNCSGINSISGGVFSGFSAAAINSSGTYVSGGTFSGCVDVFYNYYSSNISGGWFSGNKYTIDNCVPATITGGTFENSSRFMYLCQGNVNCSNITLNNFLRAADNSFNLYFYNVTLTNITTEAYNIPQYRFSELEFKNYDGVDGAYKNHTLGGTITSQTSVKPAGYAQAYLHTLSSGIFECIWKQRFAVPAGESVSVEVQLRKDASMTYLPRVYLMNSIENPVFDATAAEDSFTMSDSTDTWESDTFSIDNSAGTTDLEYTLWFVGKNASGNMYSAYDITTATGAGGGAVKIIPLGRVGL